MKNNIITLTIIALFATTVFSSEFTTDARNRLNTDEVASYLIEKFDTDNSTALNELELSGAITYLRYTRPINNRLQNSNTEASEIPHPPKVAVDLVNNFDENSDIQLTKNELSQAIAYLRNRMQDNRDSLGDAS